jgi:signal peptidase I
MGDDRAVSVDSRSSAVGCIAEENIIGKVNMIILPFSDAGKLN